MHDKLRFHYESRNTRLTCVGLLLLVALPVMLVGSLILLAGNLLVMIFRFPWLLVKSTLLSLAQIVVNIVWLFRHLVGANL